MATDLQTFGGIFLVVWGGLALYLLHLHRVARRLERELEGLRAARGREDDARKLK